MTLQLYNYFYVVNMVMSFFSIVEVIIYFKKPILFKSLLLVLISSILIVNFSLIYTSYYGYNRWLIDLPKTIMLISIFNILGFLYFHQIKRFVIIISILIFLIHLSLLFYFQFINHIKDDLALVNTSIGQFLKIIKFIIIVTIFSFIAGFYKKLMVMNKTENHFFTQLKLWFKIAIIILVFIGLNYYFVLFFKPKIEIEKGFLIINHFFLCCWILLRPRFLNRTNIKLAVRGTFATHSQKNFDKEQFFIEFFNNYYFLEPSSNLTNFAQKLNISPEVLNDYILEHYALNFTDLINKSRVDYFVELTKSGDFTHWTITALSEKAGFGSQSSLNRAFRRFHGGTPSEFIKSLG